MYFRQPGTDTVAMDTTTITPQHTCDADGPWGCDHPDCLAAAEAEQRAEIDAENAWLRVAEQGTAEDYAFERYEQEMGLGLGEIDGGGF